MLRAIGFNVPQIILKFVLHHSVCIIFMHSVKLNTKTKNFDCEIKNYEKEVSRTPGGIIVTKKCNLKVNDFISCYFF